MAKMPLLTDYVDIIIDLFEQFRQESVQSPRPGLA